MSPENRYVTDANLTNYVRAYEERAIAAETMELLSPRLREILAGGRVQLIEVFGMNYAVSLEYGWSGLSTISVRAVAR